MIDVIANERVDARSAPQLASRARAAKRRLYFDWIARIHRAQIHAERRRHGLNSILASIPADRRI